MPLELIMRTIHLHRQYRGVRKSSCSYNSCRITLRLRFEQRFGRRMKCNPSMEKSPRDCTTQAEF